MPRKFKIRGEDRRKRNEPIRVERRGGSRRDGERTKQASIVTELQGALRSLESLITRTGSTLEQVVQTRNSDEITQIPTRDDRLADAIRTLSEAQAGLVELVRGAKAAARLTPDIRIWIDDVAGRAAEVEEKLSKHMAERLRIDAPRQAPRARRLAGRLQRLLG